MIAALYASRVGGANRFQLNGVGFGWDPLIQMLHREVRRKKNNQLPRVPGLKESFIFRDPWTRLNVKPAKIMQVNRIIIVQVRVTYLDNYYFLYLARTCPLRAARVCHSVSTST